MARPDANTADVIVIGGGVAGLSTAMQLGARGRKVVLVERSALGSGSTGRAAGLLGQLRSTPAATKMLMDGLEIVKDLEARTHSKIFYKTGSLRVAQTPDRVAEVRSHVTMGKSIGFAVDHIDAAEVARLLPYMRVDDVLDACYCPTDGHLAPAELAAAYARVAREHGVVLSTQTPAEAIHVESGHVVGVRAGGRDIDGPVVVNASGPWSYLVADFARTPLPTAAIGHYYLTTRPIDAVPVDPESPAVRDRENRIYSRPESGGLIVGMYEAEPDEYDMEALPGDFDMSAMHVSRTNIHVARLLDAVGRRFPFVTERTPMTLTTGIMTFTPDGQPFCGKIREIDGLYHCAGFCGHGIVQSPAIGLIMAELIVDGATGYDVQQIEADRFFDVPEYRDRAAIKRACFSASADYYGKVVTTT